MTATVESIWNEFASALRGFIRARVRDHAAAEDILQDVFVKIHRKLPTLRADERLEAWVWRVTRNTMTDYFRRHRSNEPLAETVALAGDEPVTLPDLTPCVRRFIGELAPAHREALVLTEWQDLTQDQVAKRLGISLSGAKSRVQRARSHLKKMLLDCCRIELDRRGTVVDMECRGKQCGSGC